MMRVLILLLILSACVFKSQPQVQSEAKVIPVRAIKHLKNIIKGVRELKVEYQQFGKLHRLTDGQIETIYEIPHEDIKRFIGLPSEQIETIREVDIEFRKKIYSGEYTRESLEMFEYPSPGHSRLVMVVDGKKIDLETYNVLEHLNPEQFEVLLKLNPEHLAEILEMVMKKNGMLHGLESKEVAAVSKLDEDSVDTIID